MVIKTFFQSIIIAFSMFTKIPMPHIDWSEKGMKYMLCFFPVVGAVVGVVEILAGEILIQLGISRLLFGCIMAVLPVMVTGGIHMDGFLDTMDGISSYADKERRLEILKDSNSGAFAIIGGLVYFVLYIGFLSEIQASMLIVIGLSYISSRAMNALSLVSFKGARKKGMGATFSNGADQILVRVISIIAVVAVIICGFAISVTAGLILLISSILVFSYHYWNCMHNFGGITGDLAGYFVQIYELTVVILLVISEYMGVWS